MSKTYNIDIKVIMCSLIDDRNTLFLHCIYEPLRYNTAPFLPHEGATSTHLTYQLERYTPKEHKAIKKIFINTPNQ